MRFHRALVSVGRGRGMMDSNAAGTAQCQEKKEYLGERQVKKWGSVSPTEVSPCLVTRWLRRDANCAVQEAPHPVRFSAIAIRVHPDAVFKSFGARPRMSLALLCVPSRRATVGQFSDQAPATRFPPSFLTIGPV